MRFRPTSVPRRAGGACMAAAVDLVLQVEEAPARRRAGGAGGPAAGDGRGHRRAARAPAAIGDLVVIRCWRWPGAGGGRPAAGVCPGVVLASVSTAARRRRVHGGRRRPGAAGGGGAGSGRGSGTPRLHWHPRTKMRKHTYDPVSVAVD
ncbi:hypothetical protein LJR269_006580 [Duganella sp. LjRoot269]